MNDERSAFEMSREKHDGPKPGAAKLRVVADNTRRVAVVEAPEDAPPFHVQATALAEDTSLVLSADTETIRDPDEHPIRIMTALYDEPTREPGSVVVKGTAPYHFLAIVHDFDQEPSFREAWVWDALGEILVQCKTRKVLALKLAPLGVGHGGLVFSRFRELLGVMLDETDRGCLKRIWLVTP